MSESVNVKFLRSRDAARAAFFSAKTAERRTIPDFPLEVGDATILVTLKSPSVDERSSILKRAGIGKSKSKGKGDDRAVESETDLTTMQIEAIKACTFIREHDDETSKLVHFFTPEDDDGLRGRNAGGVFDELAEACMALVNVDEESIRKNSKRTVPSSGASSSPESSTVR